MDGLTRLLIEEQSEYLVPDKVDITLITWNLNGIQPPAIDTLSDLLLPERACGVLAVGLQELSAADSSYIGLQEQASKQNFERWTASLQFAINYKYQDDQAQYGLVGTVRLAAIGLLLFARDSLPVHIISKGVFACGMMGVLANKGAVGLKFCVHDTVFVIVSAHLAAHTEYWSRRNQDYADIRSGLRLDGTIGQSDHNYKSNEDKVKAQVRRWLCTAGNSMDDTECLFWMGDLNYRLTDTDRDRVIKLAGVCDYEQLMRFDQLKLSMFMQTAFADFCEAQVGFPPTFKYVHGGGRDFDGQRCPAYCDRILWRASEAIKSIAYDSPPIYLSDHKPVVAVNMAIVRRVDDELFMQSYSRALSRLDTMENDLIPMTDLVVVNASMRGVLSIGQCWFNHVYSGTLELRNPGDTIAEYLVGDLDDTPWITVSPQSGTIEPKASVLIHVKVRVDCQSASVLNDDPTRLNTVIVVKIVNGKDHFVSVEGRYHGSHFGERLDDLQAVPSTLLLLGKHIQHQKGTSCANMLTQPGPPSLVDTVIHMIDTDTFTVDHEYSDDFMLAVGECFLLYLSSSPEPLWSSRPVLLFVKELFEEMPEHNPTVNTEALRVVLGAALLRVDNVEQVEQFMFENVF